MENHRSASRLPIAPTAGGLVALVALLAQPHPALATTIQESIQAALATNPEVGVVAADREAIEQELRQARADYLPSIDVRGAVGPEYTDTPITRNRDLMTTTRRRCCARSPS